MVKILFTTPVLEHPAAGGSQLRIENTIKALGRVSELHCISRVPARNIGNTEALEYIKQLCHNFTFAPSASFLYSTPGFFGRIIRRLAKIFLGDAISKDAAFISEYATKIQADIIWFGYGNVSFPLIEKLRLLMPDAKFVCDTDSVWSRFILRELEVITDPIRRKVIETSGKAKEDEEKLSVQLCDVTTAVSNVDATYYRSICQQDKIHIFQMLLTLTAMRHFHLPQQASNPQPYFWVVRFTALLARWFTQPNGWHKRLCPSYGHAIPTYTYI